MLNGKRQQWVRLPFLTAEALVQLKQGAMASSPFSLECKNQGRLQYLLRPGIWKQLFLSVGCGLG